MMGLQINEKKFASWLAEVTTDYFGQIVGKEGIEDAARSCIRILGEIPWYELSKPRQVDCLDCYMVGWVDSRKSIKENFK